MNPGVADIAQVDPSRPGVDHTSVQAPFLSRLRTNALDLNLLANPVVAALFCLLRWRHLIASEPYWLYIAIVVGGGAASVVSSALWGEPRLRWHLSAHVGGNMGVIAVVAYSTGWGPILSIGFLFGAAAAIQSFGSQAKWPCVTWTAIAMVLGQLAITFHLAPTLIRGPVVQGVAALGLLGTLLVIELLGRATQDERRSSASCVNPSGASRHWYPTPPTSLS